MIAPRRPHRRATEEDPARAEEGELVPLPRPRPAEKPAVPAEAPVEAQADVTATPDPEPAEEPKPPRIYQAACPAMLLGLVEAKVLEPIADGSAASARRWR